MYFGTSYSGNPYTSTGYSAGPRPPARPTVTAGYGGTSYGVAPLGPPTMPRPRAAPATTVSTPELPARRQCAPVVAPKPAKQSFRVEVSSLYSAGMGRRRVVTGSAMQVVEASMTGSADGPIYRIKLDINGRSYVAARHHSKLRTLVEQLRLRGYRILRPFPEVEEMVTMAPAIQKGPMEETLNALPFYEGFGYSIKSLASTVLRSSGSIRKRSFQMEQISQRIDSFLKAVFSDNDDLQYEQQVYHFFWEPLEKKLQPVREEEFEEAEEDDTDTSTAGGDMGHVGAGDGHGDLGEEGKGDGELGEAAVARSCAPVLEPEAAALSVEASGVERPPADAGL
jgi:hypothetical protein